MASQIVRAAAKAHACVRRLDHTLRLADVQASVISVRARACRASRRESAHSLGSPVSGFTGALFSESRLRPVLHFWRMSLFPDRPLVRPSFMRVTLPRAVSDHVLLGEYTAAAAVLSQSGIGFNHAVRLVANSPPTLAAYLHKKSTMMDGSPAAQQIVCHLYLQTAFF